MSSEKLIRKPVLSICVPIYNHANRFRLQLDSIKDFSQNRNEVEFVVVDDESTDDLDCVLEAFRLDGWQVNAVRQKQNSGRASALKRALALAQGSFVMIMDGDDTFATGGIETILKAIENNKQWSDKDGRSMAGFIFGTNLQSEGGTSQLNVPPDGIRTNLLALRADYQIKGDLKEVVCREVVNSVTCEMFHEFRRVPTSLLWARVSERNDLICISKAVVSKVYLKGGMTDSLKTLRRNNIPPLLELYSKIASSSAYRSNWYRMRAEINYHRFLIMHGKKTSRYKIRPTMFGIPMALGFMFGIIDKFN